MFVVIRGGGDIATGIALRLYRSGMAVCLCEIPAPTAIRRTVCFSEAVRLGETTVEGITARCFCHEIEHLDGHMYYEKAEGRLLTEDEVDEIMQKAEEEKA